MCFFAHFTRRSIRWLKLETVSQSCVFYPYTVTNEITEWFEEIRDSLLVSMDTASLTVGSRQPKISAMVLEYFVC
jgi:hypothetical protein